MSARRPRALLVFAAACALVLGAERAGAHALGQGYIFLKVYDDRVTGAIELTAADLNAALGLGLSTDGSLTRADVEPHAAVIRTYLLERVGLEPDGASTALELGAPDVATIPIAQYVVMPFEFPDLAHPPTFVDVRYEAVFDVDPNHRGFLINFRNWKTGTYDDESNIALVFTPESPTQRLDLSSATVMSGVMAMVGQGVHHIWIGIDHILFLVALLLPSVVRREAGRWTAVQSFRPALWHVVGIVTVFTVAHTITLSAAVMQSMSLPPRIVESVIALSIAIAALDVIVPVFGRRIWWIVFGFGLFHGFGFASVLTDIGIPPKYLLHSLIGFNVGVELGQVAIVCALFPVLYLVRGSAFYRRVALLWGAVALIVVALYWFVERALEIDLPAGALINGLLEFF